MNNPLRAKNRPQPAQNNYGRRTLLRTVAWSTPIIAVAAATPMAAASTSSSGPISSGNSLSLSGRIVLPPAATTGDLPWWLNIDSTGLYSRSQSLTAQIHLQQDNGPYNSATEAISDIKVILEVPSFVGAGPIVQPYSGAVWPEWTLNQNVLNGTQRTLAYSFSGTLPRYGTLLPNLALPINWDEAPAEQTFNLVVTAIASGGPQTVQTRSATFTVPRW